MQLTFRNAAGETWPEGTQIEIIDTATQVVVSHATLDPSGMAHIDLDNNGSYSIRLPQSDNRTQQLHPTSNAAEPIDVNNLDPALR